MKKIWTIDGDTYYKLCVFLFWKLQVGFLLFHVHIMFIVLNKI